MLIKTSISTFYSKNNHVFNTITKKLLFVETQLTPRAAKKKKKKYTFFD